MSNSKKPGELPHWLELVIGAIVWCIFLALCAYVVLGFFLTPY